MNSQVNTKHIMVADPMHLLETGLFCNSSGALPSPDSCKYISVATWSFHRKPQPPDKKKASSVL